MPIDVYPPVVGGGGGGGAAISAAGSSVSSGTVVFSNSNNVSFGMAGSTVTGSASYPAQTNQTGISGIIVSNTTYTSGTITFQNANGMSFGSSGANGISGSYTVPSVTQFFSNTSTTFNGANISGSITLNTAGLQLSLSAGAGGSSTGGIYLQGNTSNASSTTMAISSYNLSGLGAITLAASASSIQIQVPQTSSLLGSNGISVASGGSTITVSNMSPATITASYFEPAMRGITTVQSYAAGTVYIEPFHVSENLSFAQLRMLQQFTTQPNTTMSVSGSVSGGAASSGTGSWILSGTVQLYSRQSTGTTANSSNLISFFSSSYSYGVKQLASVSWSTNASSATVSYTTSGQISFISNVGPTGGVTTGSFGTSGSGSFSSTSNAGASFSSSFVMSFASSVLSNIRPIIAGFGTSLSPGEYWLGHIQSTNSGSTNYALQTAISMGLPGILYFSSNTQGYAEIGATATTANSNLLQGWGSYSSSGNTSTTFPLSNVSGMSQYQLWFNIFNLIK